MVGRMKFHICQSWFRFAHLLARNPGPVECSQIRRQGSPTRTFPARRCDNLAHRESSRRMLPPLQPQLVLIGLAFCLLFMPPLNASWWPFKSRPKLNKEINSILASSPAHHGRLGVEVVRLRDQKMLYSRDAEQLFQPASNMKLFTTACALERLGPDFTYRTTVDAAAPPDQSGRVGNIFIIGRGDPDLSNRVLPYHLKTERRGPADAAFQQLAEQMVTRGVKVVAGNIVADDSYFRGSPFPPDWAIDDMVWGYGAPVTALTFEDNELLLHIQPGAAIGLPAKISVDPLPHYYSIRDEVDTVAANESRKIDLYRPPASRTLTVRGQIPLDSTGDEETIAIQNPAKAIGDLFRRDLEERGIRVLGHVVEEATSGGPASSMHMVILAEHKSPPLAEDIQMTLKVSQNLHAEMLLRTLAHRLSGVGSRKAGIKILDHYVQGFGVTPHEVYFVDGSGLSRAVLVSPAAITKLLIHMSRSPEFKIFKEGLPVAGVDGTLSDRFKGTPAQGRILGKTGTLEHVNSLSGYMDLPQGEVLAFSILLNNNPLHGTQGEALVDRVALAIFKTYATRQVAAIIPSTKK